MNKYWALVLVFMFSCDSGFKNDPYAEHIIRYLEEVPKLDLSQKPQVNKVIIIPLSGCSPCLQEVLAFLNEIENVDVELLFVGKSVDLEVQSLVKKLKTRYQYNLDEDNMLMFYRTNISNPSLLIIEGSDIIKLTLDLNNYSDIISKQAIL